MVEVFQSTLSHGERLPFSCIIKTSISISIHSLAWRETKEGKQMYTLMAISIHSLAWRETTDRGLLKKKEVFQSTLSHGERPQKTT